MRTTLSLLAVVLVLAILGGCALTSHRGGTHGVAFYVAPNGDDGWSGALPKPDRGGTDGPFATLERARDAIRDLKLGGGLPSGGVAVFVRGGTYPLEKTLELGPEDSGAPDAPIVYRNYGREEVFLIGGREIRGFVQRPGSPVLFRVPMEAHAHVLECDLAAEGIRDYGEYVTRGFGRAVHPAALELFFEGRPMQVARWPNEGWATIADVPDGPDGGKFTYEGDRPERWVESLEDLLVHGYWTYDWAESYEHVKAIDTDSKEIHTREPHGVYGYKKGKRFQALNVLEELDEPGEWYVDRKSGKLYFWPPERVADGKAFVSLLETPLIAMRDVSHVTIRGMHLAYGRGHGVLITGGSHNTVAGCVIRNLGNTGVIVNGGTHNGVLSCDIDNTGDGGIVLSGGDRLTLTPGDNYATNNHIHDYSRWCRTYRPAVMVSGVGNKVSHNLIHHAPHNAVQLSGNEHCIEYNEIHSVCYETGDVGAFYMGRDWTMRGTVVRYNYFHHLGGMEGGSGGFIDAMAIYLDDAASGTTSYGNICYKAGRAVLLGGGHDNTFENNIFIDCEPSIHVDARAIGWAKKYALKGGGWHMYEKLEAVNYDQPPYSTRYPSLATILEEDPAQPKRNQILRNISVGGRWLDLMNGLDDTKVQIEQNLVDEDPLFVDAENADFRLEEGSPAFELGFEPIPVEEIGLYKDEFRRSLPRR